VPNHLHSAVYRRIKRANGHLETIIEMIEQGHSRAEISQQIQAVESATENAKKALIHDHLGLGVEQSVKSTGQIQGRQADRKRDVLDVVISSEEDTSRIFMRFAKDLGFDLDAIHLFYQREYRDRTTTVSETKPIASENGPSEGVSRGRFSPLRVSEASQVILVAVGSRVILVAIFAAVLWAAITLVS
jgi:DNA-binding FrmR family transcriptional regulator